jgi:O-antigen/teichoic acid export membrane protein
MLKSTGAVLARNSLYNFGTQIIVSVVAFVSIPVIVRGLGEESFGILTIMWMAVGYFSVLDLGVGQASVKFVAEQIARNEPEDANSTIWVSVGVGAILGSVLWLLALLLIPLLQGQVGGIPLALQAETRRSFYWIALAIPFVMVQGAFLAVPKGVQRFDLLNLLFGLSGLLQWGGSLLLILMGKGLFEIALLTVAIRVSGAFAALLLAHALFPGLSMKKVTNVVQTAKKLFSFGGWLTVTQLVSPVSRYLDRAFVVSYQSLKMFTFYAVPYEALSRLQLMPLSLSTTLFPAMSEREGVKAKAELLSLYWRAINFTILVMLPVGMVLMVFSRTILALWLGGDFPVVSDNVFKLLAASAFVQAICYVPLTSLQAIGRPDVTTKYYIAEIPLYIGLCFLLIPSFGVEGAAWAYLIRMVINAMWFLWMAHRTFGSSIAVSGPIQRSLSLNLVFLLCLVMIATLVHGVVSQVVAICFTGIAYLLAVWSFCLDAAEKQVVQKLISSRT